MLTTIIGTKKVGSAALEKKDEKRMSLRLKMIAIWGSFVWYVCFCSVHVNFLEDMT